MRRLSLAASAAVLMLAMTGCGSDSDDEKADPKPSASETTEDAPESLATGDEELFAGLLTVDDVPSGLEEIDPDDEDEETPQVTSGAPECQALLDGAFSDGFDLEAKSAFEDEEGGLRVTSQVNTFAEGDVAPRLDAFAAAIAACPQFAAADSDGEYEFALTPFETGLGERSVATLIELGVGGEKLAEFWLAATSIGDTISFTRIVTGAAIDPAVIDELNGVAADKLADLVDSLS